MNKGEIVICLNNISEHRLICYPLTIGKQYTIHEDNKLFCFIKDDNGKLDFYSTFWFKKLSDVREETINNLLKS